MQPEQLLLRHREVDIERVERSQRRQCIAGVDILPEIDPADADLAGERSADDALRDLGVELIDRGLGLDQLFLALLDHLLADEAGRRQPLRALVLQLREAAARQQPVAFRPLRRIVELHQRRALGNRLAGLEIDRNHATGDFRRQCHLADRLQRPDRFDRLRQDFRPHHHGRHRRRRMGIGDIRCRQPRCPPRIDGGEQAQQRDDGDRHRPKTAEGRAVMQGNGGRHVGSGTRLRGGRKACTCKPTRCIQPQV